MSLAENIEKDFKQAMRNKEDTKLSTLRMLKSALQNKSIELKRGTMEESDILAVIQKELKKRQDAILAFSSGGRQEMADKEKAEAAILAAYLPAGLGEAEIVKIVEEAIASQGNNFGLVMKEVMAQTRGRADGQLVQRLVKEKLGI
ncbi:MAG: aspartyl-tRNA amidotransferase [Parcubacteria group bacterium]|nr:MAG: aspartyl-tRNA amidotransferase [Parcubacteria group bacterium]